MAMLLVDRHVLVATRSDMIAVGVRTVLGAYDIKTECCRTLSACIPDTVDMIFLDDALLKDRSLASALKVLQRWAPTARVVVMSSTCDGLWVRQALDQTITHARFQALLALQVVVPALDDAERTRNPNIFRLLSLDYGVEVHRAELAWLDNTLARLRRMAAPPDDQS